MFIALFLLVWVVWFFMRGFGYGLWFWAGFGALSFVGALFFPVLFIFVLAALFYMGVWSEEFKEEEGELGKEKGEWSEQTKATVQVVFLLALVLGLLYLFGTAFTFESVAGLLAALVGLILIHWFRVKFSKKEE
jgi:hypothetical protein